jgi:propane monooxygenase large subunit
MPEILSPNVILNEMSADQRAAFHADYIKQGPAGRPAPADS